MSASVNLSRSNDRNYWVFMLEKLIGKHMCSMDIWGRLRCWMTDESGDWRDVEREGPSFEVILACV